MRMTLGQRSMVVAFVLTVLLSVGLVLSSLGQYVLIAGIIALPVFFCLWHVLDRKARAFWIVFTYKHPAFLRPVQASPYYVPLDAQPKQVRAIEYEQQPQAQYR